MSRWILLEEAGNWYGPVRFFWKEEVGGWGMSELILKIELIPQPLWGRSLYRRLPRRVWGELRKRTLAQYNNRCGICGADGNICHETWAYDDMNHVADLTGLILICPMCNYCKHLGLAGKIRIDPLAIMDHFCCVNNIHASEFTPIRVLAFNQWAERNKYEWMQDFGEYSSLVHQ